MLLNQCLAISLSPITSDNKVQQEQIISRKLENSKQCRQEARLDENLADKEEEEEESKYKDDHTVTSKHQQIRPDSKFFEQLIAQNTILRSDNSKTTNTNIENEVDVSRDKVLALKEALDRVEFAGFMVPSWLLLSGSYNDLHCIKTSWLEGTFKSPAGFKIETIGK